jgi:hypothetical protein
LPWLPWLRLAWLQVRRLRWLRRLLLTLGTVPHLLTSRGISVRRRLSTSLVISASGPASIGPAKHFGDGAPGRLPHPSILLPSSDPKAGANAKEACPASSSARRLPSLEAYADCGVPVQPAPRLVTYRV